MSNLEVNGTRGLSFFPGKGLPWLTAGRNTYVDTRATAKSGQENHSSALPKCGFLAHPRCFEEEISFVPYLLLHWIRYHIRMSICLANFDVEVVAC